MALVALPLSTYVTMVGGHQIARHNLPLVKLAMLIVLNNLPFFRMPQHSFHEELLHDFPEHRGEADCSFFKNWSDISYSPVTGDFT